MKIFENFEIFKELEAAYLSLQKSAFKSIFGRPGQTRLALSRAGQARPRKFNLRKKVKIKKPRSIEAFYFENNRCNCDFKGAPEISFLFPRPPNDCKYRTSSSIWPFWGHEFQSFILAHQIFMRNHEKWRFLKFLGPKMPLFAPKKKSLECEKG